MWVLLRAARVTSPFDSCYHCSCDAASVTCLASASTFYCICLPPAIISNPIMISNVIFNIFVIPLLLPSPLPPFIPLLSPSRTSRSQVISCSPSPPPSSALCSLVTTQESSMLQRWLVNISNLMWCRLHTIGDISYCKDCKYKYLISQALQPRWVEHKPQDNRGTVVLASLHFNPLKPEPWNNCQKALIFG